VPFSAGSESISPIGVEHDPVSPRRRIEAAEHLLDYECPEEVRVECKEFLTSNFDDDEQQVDIRLDALKLARKFEAAKVTPRTIHTTQREGDRREAWRRYEISQRHWKLSLAIHDTPPKGWADDFREARRPSPIGLCAPENAEVGLRLDMYAIKSGPVLVPREPGPDPPSPSPERCRRGRGRHFPIDCGFQ
jgi:hypothetical protein